jgi:hypothetical protein
MWSAAEKHSVLNSCFRPFRLQIQLEQRCYRCQPSTALPIPIIGSERVEPNVDYGHPVTQEWLRENRVLLLKLSKTRQEEGTRIHLS